MKTVIDQLKCLNDDLGQAGADIASNLTEFPSGSAMLDVRQDGRAFVMAYWPAGGFGVDELRPDEGLGNHYQFTYADFESAARKLRALTESPSPRQAPALALLVVQARDMEAALQFYHLLGLNFESERHGAGPLHYAAALGPMVFEIYPCRNDRPATPVRIGFRIPALDSTLELLRQRGARIISEPKETPWGRRAVVEDPDGNRVELMA